MNQVHKENLTHVENANPGRQGLEIEIFGMEGVPPEIIDTHINEVTQAHFAEEQERARITGNPIRGAYGNDNAPPNKRPKVTETLEEIEARAAKFREDRKNGVLPMQVEVKAVESQPGPFQTPAYPPPANGAAPARPGSIPSAIPPRPVPGTFQTAEEIQASIDDLVLSVTKEATPAEKKDDKKSKKDKNVRLIYHDDHISPEEKMALLPRFAEFVRT